MSTHPDKPTAEDLVARSAELRELLDAVDQCLDDMGAAGRCVCGLAHAQLRIAYEPFRLAYPDEGGDLPPEPGLTLAAAQKTILSVLEG